MNDGEQSSTSKGYYQADCYRLDTAVLCVFFPGGVFRLQEGQWQWAERESYVWDRTHQAVFRNFRAQAIELPEDVPPVPEPPSTPSPRKREPKTYRVPEAVADWVGAGGGQRTAVILLSEDGWESAFGDGKFHETEGCFPSEEACDEYLAEHGEPRHYAYHRRRLEIVDRDGEVRALNVEDRHWADRFTVPAMLRDLAERLQGSEGD